MTQLHTVNCPNVVIPNGQSNSPWIRADRVHGDAETVGLLGLLTTDGAITYLLEVTNDALVAVPDAFTLQNDTPADVAPPLQGKARFYEGLAAFAAFRIHASAPVTADRTWKMNKQTFV